jgi:hypothetical protein
MGDPARGVEVRVPTRQLGTKRAPVSSTAADNGTKSQAANLALVGNLNERFHRIPGMLRSLHAKQQLVVYRRVSTRQLGRRASSGSPSHPGGRVSNRHGTKPQAAKLALRGSGT